MNCGEKSSERGLSLKEQMKASQKRKACLRRKKEEKEKKGGRPLTELQRMKFEIAGELGLLEKVKKEGFGALSARETGRIGGLMRARKKAQEKGNKAEKEGTENAGTDKPSAGIHLTERKHRLPLP